MLENRTRGARKSHKMQLEGCERNVQKEINERKPLKSVRFLV